MTRGQEKRPPPQERPLTNHFHLTVNITRRRQGDPTLTTETTRESTPELAAWRRQQFAHDLRCRRRISKELDLLGGVDRAGEKVDSLQPLELTGEPYDPGGGYGENGMSLGWPERRTAGLAMTDWHNQDAA